MKVLKFGGTSVGSPDRMKSVSELVNDGEPKIVVLSAMSGTTNSLVQISEYFYKKNFDAANDCINELERKYSSVVESLLSTSDYKKQGHEVVKQHFGEIRSFINKDFILRDEKIILAQGELLSTKLVTLYNKEKGVDVELIPALDYMRIDEDGEPDMMLTGKLLNSVLDKNKGKKLYITQGFICRNPHNEIDNLKRGGSDYSAAIVGALIDSPEVQIWTDIDGVHNNDPRIVKTTKPIAQLSFDEAAELAYFGAKVLHPSTVLPVKVKNIPVILKNTMDPNAPGTIISNEITDGGIKAVAAKDGITAINIKSSRMLMAYGFLRKVFEIFEKYKTPVDMITTSEVAVSLTIDKISYLEDIKNELCDFGFVSVDEQMSIICIVGNLGSNAKIYAEQIFRALEDIPVRMISYGGSPFNISILISTNDKIKALNLLNQHIFKLQ